MPQPSCPKEEHYIHFLKLSHNKNYLLCSTLYFVHACHGLRTKTHLPTPSLPCSNTSSISKYLLFHRGSTRWQRAESEWELEMHMCFRNRHTYSNLAFCPLEVWDIGQDPSSLWASVSLSLKWERGIIHSWQYDYKHQKRSDDKHLAQCCSVRVHVAARNQIPN